MIDGTYEIEIVEFNKGGYGLVLVNRNINFIIFNCDWGFICDILQISKGDLLKKIKECNGALIQGVYNHGVMVKIVSFRKYSEAEKFLLEFANPIIIALKLTNEIFVKYTMDKYENNYYKDDNMFKINIENIKMVVKDESDL